MKNKYRSKSFLVFEKACTKSFRVALEDKYKSKKVVGFLLDKKEIKGSKKLSLKFDIFSSSVDYVRELAVDYLFNP